MAARKLGTRKGGPYLVCYQGVAEIHEPFRQRTGRCSRLIFNVERLLSGDGFADLRVSNRCNAGFRLVSVIRDYPLERPLWTQDRAIDSRGGRCQLQWPFQVATIWRIPARHQSPTPNSIGTWDRR